MKLEGTGCLYRREYLLSALFSLITITSSAKRDDSCEVCVKFMGKYIDSLAGNIGDSTRNEEVFKEMCRSAGGKENSFCYRVGGLDISATSIIAEIMPPVKSGVPAGKICDRIRKKIPDICDLKYDKPIDLSNLNKLKVKDLKKVLADWGKLDACRGCMEKSEYIRAVEDLLPKYAPEYAKAKREL